METQKTVTPSSHACWSPVASPSVQLQHTAVGAVTESNANETAVVMTPAFARELSLNGHKVYVQYNFASKAGFTDEQYAQAGATLCNTAEEVYQKSSIILRVNIPEEQEFKFIQPQQVMFCFVPTTGYMQQQHERFLQVMREKQGTVISYNALTSSVASSASSFFAAPVQHVLQEIAAYLGVQQAMLLQQQTNGVSFASITGCSSNNVLILGAGVCGVRAAALAAAAGANVTLMDSNTEALRSFASNNSNYGVHTVQYTQTNLENLLPNVNTIIATVTPTAGTAPVLVNEQQMLLLQPGTVVIDLAAPYGGNFAATKPQNVQNCTYTWKSINMYTPNNITALTPKTTSTAVAQAALPFVLQVANKGWRRAVIDSIGIQQGLFVAGGSVTNAYIASNTQCTYTPVEQVLEKDIQLISDKQSTDITQLKQQLNSFRIQQQGASFTVEA